MKFIYKKESNEFFTKDRVYEVFTLMNFDEIFVKNDKGVEVKARISDFVIK